MSLTLRSFLFIAAVAILSSWLSACRPPEEQLTLNPAKGLRFSVDTVKFDTVFTQVRTTTRRLKLYNDNDNAVKLDEVSLPAGSTFRMIVGGLPAPVRGLTIRGKDSLLILLEGQIDPNNEDTPFIIEDSVIVRVQGRNGYQRARIIAYGQNANYLTDSVLNCSRNWVWNSVRPYIVVGNVLVDSCATLTIQQGVKVFFYAGANLLVKGRLLVNGTVEQPVLFSGTRREAFYSRSPGQWGAIAFLGNTNSTRIGRSNINFAIIENARVGVQVNTPTDLGRSTVTLRNTLIRHCSEVGLFAFNGILTAFNNVIVDCAQFTLGIFMGGNYNLWHNTFAYSGNLGFSRQNPSVVMQDSYDDQVNPVKSNPLKVDFINNIVSGNRNEELVFPAPVNSTTPELLILNNALRSQLSYPAANNNILLSRPYPFRGPTRYNFIPDTLSVGLERGLPLSQIPNRDPGLNSDFRAQPRPSGNPDIGAMQFGR